MAGAVGQVCLMEQLHLGYYFLFFVPSQYLLYRDYQMSKEGTCPQLFYNFKTAYHTYMMLYMTLGLFTLLNYKASRRKQANCLSAYNLTISEQREEYAEEETRILREFRENRQ